MPVRERDTPDAQAPAPSEDEPGGSGASSSASPAPAATRAAPRPTAGAAEARPGGGRYRRLEEVGRGGMAVVYRGLDTTLNREVAVKVLHPHLADETESRQRLQREAHAVAKLHHENILEIFDYSGPESPESYIVTEFIHGRTLKGLLSDTPLPFPELAEMIVSEVARALEHAHALGVLHRDIKPENVMIRDDGRLKLMDFGIAQIVDKERMTVTGQLLGSPAYMSPEHVEGRPLDFRTDVFALGILLYQLATGELPFRGKNPHEVLKRIAECKYIPAPQVNPRVGTRLGRVIARALERDPQARHGDVAVLRKELLEDLADAGVEDPRVELQAFFADPEGYAARFRPRLLQCLADRGRALAKRGRTAAALELWSRGLAVDPRSPELRALVEGAGRRRRALFLGGVALALLSAGSGLALAWRTLRQAALRGGPPLAAAPRTPPESGRPAPAPAPTGARPAGAARPTRSEPRPTSELAGPPDDARLTAIQRRIQHPVAPHAAATASAAAPRQIELLPIPSNVRVALDGQDLGEYDPTRRYELTEGPHAFTLTSDFCFPKTVTVAPEQAGQIAVRLKWRDATLVIRATPPDADVLVDGIPTVFTAGQPIRIAIPEMSDDGRREVRLKVSARGHRSQALALKLRAHERHEETVFLEAAE